MKDKKTKKTFYSEDIPTQTKATVRRLFHRLSCQKGRLLVIAAAAVLSSISFAAMPLLVGSALDSLLAVLKTNPDPQNIPALIAQAIGLPVVLLLAVSAVSSLLAYVQQYVIASVGENLTMSLRQDISAKLNRLPLHYFDHHETGDIMSRVTNDLEKVSSVMQMGMIQFISSALTISLTCVIMLILSPRLFAVTLFSTIVCGIATNFVSRWSQRCYAKNMETMGALGGKVEETYAGNRIIKVFSRQESVIDELNGLGQAQFEANRMAQFADFSIYPSIRLLNQLGFIAVAVAGGLIALSGGMTLGGVQAFLQYVNQISEPISQMAYVITSMQAAIAGAERVFNLLDEEEEVTSESENALDLAGGSVHFQNVKFGYTPNRILIKDLSLKVHPNEMVAIVGPTGGGKTTLINLLMRFYELNGGAISIDGTDISAISRGALRRSIGMVLQDTWLFEGTVAENIAYGKMDASREEIIGAAKAACCHHFIRTLPQGYDTIVSTEAPLLSQGQMQLLTIARAMLTNPGILILDEATSSVDTRTEVEIQKAMTRLMKDKTSFVIAHRLSTIRNANMILVVQDGDIIERGTHKGLLEKQGFYASLYRSQFESAS